MMRPASNGSNEPDRLFRVRPSTGSATNKAHGKQGDRRSPPRVQRDSNRHGQHHRIEHRHTRQLSGGKRRSCDNPIQEQARQNFVTVPAGPSLDD
jgi:hypothetical protein